jgi:DnaJ family protein B protein 4
MYNETSFYNILGVDEKASSDEIKKAFRKLSLIYHPDRDSGDEDKFKKITEAYDILSNPTKRKTYDMQNSSPFKNLNSMNYNSMNYNFSNDDLINILLHDNPNISPFFFNHSRKENTSKKPSSISKTIQISIEQSYNGCVLPLLVERKNNKTTESETIYVDIPKGIDNNEFIIIENKGNISDDFKGDVKVIIIIKHNESNYERDGLDLIYNHEITLKEALCGFDFKLTHISGKIINFNNSEGNIIYPSYKKIIQNLGFVRNEHKGNLIINFKIKFPNSLSKNQVKNLNNIL